MNYPAASFELITPTKKIKKISFFFTFLSKTSQKWLLPVSTVSWINFRSSTDRMTESWWTFTNWRSTVHCKSTEDQL